MHARVSTYTGDADGLVEGFRSATGQLEEVDGFVQAFFLVDRESGKGISMTIWDSEQALNASAERADQLRKGASELAGATIDSVAHYEIAMTASAKNAAVG